MNKNMIFSIVMMIAAATAILPIQASLSYEEQVRRDYICQLSQAKALSVAQYFENGAFSYDLIARDIAILKKDNEQVLSSKSWAEGYFYSGIIPGSAQLVAIGTGLGALVGGIATIIRSFFTYDVWTSSLAANFTDSFYSQAIKAASNNLPDRIEATFRYWDAKAEYLARQSEWNRQVLREVPLLPVVLGGTLVLAGLCKYSSKKLANYKQRNADFIAEMQARYNCNQIAIAQLQQIAFDANRAQL